MDALTVGGLCAVCLEPALAGEYAELVAAMMRPRRVPATAKCRECGLAAGRSECEEAAGRIAKKMKTAEG